MNVHWAAVADAITQATGSPFHLELSQSVGGGCINTAYRLEGGGRCYFVKLNNASCLDMFEAEAAGLKAMADTHTIRVPEPICHGIAGNFAFLVLEYLELVGGGGARSLEALGERLAALHRIHQPYFGWHRDNTIGSTPQINTPAEDWVAFWRERRLGFQLELAAKNGFGDPLQRNGERLMADLETFFVGYTPQPSLLHGDLWGGNYAALADGEPVTFDPAVYYGDREADLAMTELFGGFGTRFLEAYQHTDPVDPGYSVRKVLYNLYHILNHLNLFGGGYLLRAQSMTERLL